MLVGGPGGQRYGSAGLGSPQPILPLYGPLLWVKLRVLDAPLAGFRAILVPHWNPCPVPDTTSDRSFKARFWLHLSNLERPMNGMSREIDVSPEE